MPKEEWGTKRLCPTTGKRFYDLNADPVISPYTGEVVEVDQSKSRMIAADAEDAVTAKAKKAEGKTDDDEDLVDDDDVDVDLDDDLLDDDEDDDDTVPLEEIADVASDDDDS
ncbi:TIGR02300 family protein [Sulfitobacter sp. HNIBRBA3233]|uniref:TIGR02300 family protein n=1 Tax=Sulfitobacter marinivivus TaxID=3158558 RepID=UPI0032DFD933